MALASERAPFEAARHVSDDILFASAAERPDPYALSRALAIADLQGGRLHVLRVLPEPTLLSGLLGLFLHNDDLRQVTEFVGVARASSAWYAQVLGARFSEERSRLCIGGFGEQVAAAAHAVGARWIVVPAGEWPGSTITALAREARLPVLVVREVDHANSVIAASDLGPDRSRILQQATELALQLKTSVVALHNVLPSHAHSAASRQTALAWGEGMPISVTTRGTNHAQGILNEARARRADTVVIGTHARSAVARLVSRSVAVQVIDGARRSVLVLPMIAAGQGPRAAERDAHALGERLRGARLRVIAP